MKLLYSDVQNFAIMFVKSNVLLLGSGGVGTIVALNLEGGGLASVTAVLRSNYDQVERNGFDIKSCDHGELKGWRPSKSWFSFLSMPKQKLTKIAIVVGHVPSTKEHKFDYIVCTTKNVPDCHPTLVETIAPAVTLGHTVIVLLQNGINIEKPVIEAFPNNAVLSGISYIRSHELKPGVIEHMDHDELVLGPFRNPALLRRDEESFARQFCEMYSAGRKTRCVYDDDVAYSRWRKLMYNACINSICAATGLDTGRVQQTGSLVDGIVRPAMNEIVAAAKASGVHLPSNITEDVIGHLEPVDMHFSPSMLVDVEKVGASMIDHNNTPNHDC